MAHELPTPSPKQLGKLQTMLDLNELPHAVLVRYHLELDKLNRLGIREISTEGLARICVDYELEREEPENMMFTEVPSIDHYHNGDKIRFKFGGKEGCTGTLIRKAGKMCFVRVDGMKYTAANPETKIFNHQLEGILVEV